MGSVFLKFIAGATVGLLTGFLTEPIAPKLAQDPRWNQWGLIASLLFGGLLGLVVGGLDGLSRGGPRWIARGIGLGAVLGAVSSSFAFGLGTAITTAIFKDGWWLSNTSLFVQIAARAIEYTVAGSLLGIAIGVSALNVRKAVQGGIGGLIGGAVAGVCLVPISLAFANPIIALREQAGPENDVGGPGRVVGWIVLGSMIALMIGLVERLTRKAWLRADFGRNEYKEWPLDAAQNFLGRGETCHVILRNDPAVAPVHASISKQGHHFVLADAGTPAGTFVNGHRIAQASLNPGDVVQIGGFALRFMTKSAQVAYAPHMTMPQASMPPQARMPPGYGAPPPMTQGPMPNAPYGMPPQAMPPPGYGAPPPTGQPTVAFAAPPQGGPTLVAMDGPHAGRRFPITMPIEIGREAAGIALTGDANASRRHASVSPAAGGLQVTDLGSTNGTYVDGARVTSALARPGSLVKVGSATFRVE